MRFVNTKTVILVIVTIALLFIIKNIVGSILTLRQNSRIVSTLKGKEQEEKQKRQFLKQQLYFVNTPQFVENEAREKLGMVKPGEHIVLAPPPTESKKVGSTSDNVPNWERWWKLFF